jgi:hypothetical protein
MTDFSLDRVAGALNARGIAAEVDQTGGGTATLFAGERFFDRDGEPRWQVLAGPGWFEGPGMLGDAMAATEEFSVGLDDSGDSGYDDVDVIGSGPTHAVEDQIVELIVDRLSNFVWPDGAYQRADGHWGDHDVLADERKRVAGRRPQGSLVA